MRDKCFNCGTNYFRQDIPCQRVIGYETYEFEQHDFETVDQNEVIA